MIYIKKRDPPKKLEEYKNKDGACFNNLPSDVKEDLRQTLFDDQGGICCYCGRQIKNNHTSVIEHLFPKGVAAYNHLQLEYSNLLCSCDGGESDRKGKTKAEKRCYPSFCDSKKNDRIIKVTPLNEDCGSKFSFDEDGHIYGTTDEARETIEILGLDCATLVHLRQAAIDAYKDLELDNSGWEEEIELLSKRSNGCFLPFFFVIVQYIENYKLF